MTFKPFIINLHGFPQYFFLSSPINFFFQQSRKFYLNFKFQFWVEIEK